MRLTLGSADSVTEGVELTATDGRVEGDSVGLVETGAIVGLAGIWVGVSASEICVVVVITDGLSVVAVVASSSSAPT